MAGFYGKLKKRVAAMTPTPMVAAQPAVPAAPTAATVFGNTVKPAPTQVAPTTMSPEGFMQSYASAYNAANQANEQRYGDILGGYKDMYGLYKAAGDQAATDYTNRLNNAMTYLNNAGAQEASDIRKGWTDQAAKGAQQLASLGMSGTTVAPTMAMGYQRESNADLSRLNERLQNQRLNTYGQYSGDVLGSKDKYTAGGTDIMQNALNFKERRNDLLPDMGTYANLALQLGKAGYGPGAGGDGSGGAGGAGGYGGAGGTSNMYAGTDGTTMWVKDPRTGQMVRAPYIQGVTPAGWYNNGGYSYQGVRSV